MSLKLDVMFQELPKLNMIVNLSIDRENNGLVLVGQGLGSAIWIQKI